MMERWLLSYAWVVERILIRSKLVGRFPPAMICHHDLLITVVIIKPNPTRPPSDEDSTVTGADKLWVPSKVQSG